MASNAKAKANKYFFSISNVKCLTTLINKSFAHTVVIIIYQYARMAKFQTSSQKIAQFFGVREWKNIFTSSKKSGGGGGEEEGVRCLGVVKY